MPNGGSVILNVGYTVPNGGSVILNVGYTVPNGAVLYKM